MKKITYLLILISISWFGALANAATHNVSTTPELRVALAAAATNGEDDIIILADGTYKTTDDGLGSFNYITNKSNSLTLEGAQRENVLLDGDYQNEILNHASTAVDSPLILKGVSFVNGVSNSSEAGAVNSNFDITIQDCLFEDNAGGNGGAIHQWSSNKQLVLNNSIFENNKASRAGGAIFTGALLDISNSVFLNNHTLSNNGLNSIGGGAIYSRNLHSSGKSSIINTKFNENISLSGRGGALNIIDVILNNVELVGNSSEYSGGAIDGDGLLIQNSLIKNNSSDSGSGVGFLGISDIVNSIIIYNTSANNDSGVLGTYGSVVNSLIANNSAGLKSYAASIANSVFYANGSFDISLGPNGSKTISELYHNYIDTSILGPNYLGEGNIFDKVALNFTDVDDDNYRLKSTSELIDAGFTGFVEGVDIPATDMDGNSRVSGGAIDIGPYEFSTTRPTIINFDVVGVRKVDQALLFVTEATASAGRTIASYEIDNGDGSFVFAGSEFSVSYTTSGQRSVQVKVTDDQGEWSAQSLTISIADLTLEEKIEVATETGRQDVINNPATYGLALASEIPAAREEQIAACLASPSSCGINIPNADIDGNGTQDALTDGLLILRYSFGLTGDSLISGVVAEDATRTTAEEIEAYLETLMPAI